MTLPDAAGTKPSADTVRDPRAFVLANTVVAETPLVPEIRLHLASEVVPLWQATEEELAATGLPPPFWAFAWAGGQALARYILDHPDQVRGKRVLDFAAGSGIQGIAAMKAGAGAVDAVEIDRFACAAVALNATLNQVTLGIEQSDWIGAACAEHDVILAGDVCYEGPLAQRIEAWLRRLVGDGKTVLLGDPGRSYLPRAGLERIIAYGVKTSRELEDSDLRNAVVWRVLGPNI